MQQCSTTVCAQSSAGRQITASFLLELILSLVLYLILFSLATVIWLRPYTLAPSCTALRRNNFSHFDEFIFGLSPSWCFYLCSSMNLDIALLILSGFLVAVSLVPYSMFVTHFSHTRSDYMLRTKHEPVLCILSVCQD